MAGTANRLRILLKKVLFRIQNLENDNIEENFKMAKKERLKELHATANVEDVIKTSPFNHIYQIETAVWTLYETISMEIENMANIIDETFKATSRAVLPQEILQPRLFQINYGENLVYHTYNNSRTHYYEAMFLLSSASIRHHITGHFFTKMVSEACNRILPPLVKMNFVIEYIPMLSILCTEILLYLRKETGTSECRFGRMINRIPVFIISITSRMPPHLLDMRIERFLEIEREKLQNISRPEFQKIRFQQIMNMMSENTGPIFNFHWNEIRDHYYKFDMRKDEEQELGRLQKEDIIALYEEIFAKRAPKRRLLRMCMLSKNLRGSISQDTSISTEEVNFDGIKRTIIKDTQAFKNSSILLSVPTPRLHADPRD